MEELAEEKLLVCPKKGWPGFPSKYSELLYFSGVAWKERIPQRGSLCKQGNPER